MTLQDCTKEELIFIIKRLTIFDKAILGTALVDVEYERIKKKLAEAERWGQVADSCREKYIEFLKKHEGMKLLDIPVSEIEEAEGCLKDAKKADQKYENLMKEVDAYGTQIHRR